MPSGVITIPVVPGMDSFGALLKSGLGAALVTAGIGAGFGEVIKLGNDFTESLNRLQAATDATGTQMEAIRAKAKELGNDMTLPAASASDAAAAMLELAKGGFTVEQSMQAAKGALQLAAAAQIDAGQAAEIQSQALSAFNLGADQATHVADVLTNIANSAQGNITDFAMAFKAGSAVASQFGLTIEDTSAALGILAKAGIGGSDAGTLLKSTLLALNNQSKPTQQALDELGVSIFDGAHNVRPFRDVIDELAQAQKRMTPEAFNAAAGIAFGSDAIRAASIFAREGVPAFDGFRESVNEAGSAGRTADALMQGLPGALKQVENAAQNAALELYDLVDGPLEKLATGAASGLTAATTGISNAIKNVGDSGISSSPALKGFVDSLGTLKEIGVNVVDNLKPLGEGIVDVVSNLGESGGIISTVGSAFDGFLHIVSGSVAVMEPITSAIGGLASFFSELPGPVQTAGVALVGFRLLLPPVTAGLATAGAAASRFAIVATGQVVGALAATTGAFTAASAAATRFGTVGAIAAGSAGVMRAGISGLASLAGGPLVLGLVAATYAFSSISSAADRTKQVFDDYRSHVDAVTKSNEELKKALTESGGLVDDNVFSVVKKQVEELRSSSEKLASEAPGFWGQVGAGISTAWDAIDGSIDGGATKSYQAAQSMSKDGATIVAAMDKTGLSSGALTKLLTGNSSAFLDFTSKLTQAGGESSVLAGKLQEMRAEFTRSQSSATKVGDAMQEIDDKAVSATKGIANLVNAMSEFRANSRTVEDAQKALTLALDNLKRGTEEAGGAFVDNAGKIDLSTTAGVKLDDQMQQVQRAYDQAGAAARTSATDQHLSAAETDAAVAAAYAHVREQFIATAIEAGRSKTEAEALANAYLSIPKDIPTTVTLTGVPEAQRIINEFIESNRNKSVAIGVYAEALNPSAAAIAPVPSLQGLLLPQNAAGGKLPTTGPGTATTDGILAVTGAGMPVAMVDGGEWIVNSDSSAKYDREIAMMNAGTFPKLPGFADGGRIAVDRAAAFLSSQSGKPYVYGGTGGQGFDCSGFISAGYAALRNLDTATRWFTTESDFGALGFESGLGPKEFLDIGVHNGGGGKMSHMAGTLNGVPFEAGANGVRYGTGATGAGDAQFEHKYHLPGELFVPADDGNGSDNTGGKDKGKGTEADSTTSTPPVPKATDGTSPTSVQDVLGNLSEGLGNAAKSFVSGQLSSAFSALGISQSSNSFLGGIGAAVDYGVKLKDYKPPTFSQAELATQGPVTPGTPNWYAELMKTFRVPAIDTVIRDQGGPLKHGQAALNLSGQTEWVSTAAQRAQEMALLRNVPRTGGSNGGAPQPTATRVMQNDYHITVSSEKSQMRELKLQNQMAVMQFGAGV